MNRSAKEGENIKVGDEVLDLYNHDTNKNLKGKSVIEKENQKWLDIHKHEKS